jgi:hypothetical protein
MNQYYLKSTNPSKVIPMKKEMIERNTTSTTQNPIGVKVDSNNEITPKENAYRKN